MKVTQWSASQKVNGTIEEVWNFFSNPDNLDQLTPKEVNFSIKSISLLDWLISLEKPKK